ncbi:MAG: winged helix-turn-helix domain-containing protein [Bacteroidaceae bacterium]|nr:winged helix-turn-helix domain-containing protein [Bacteroidaceae bacterium]
MTALHCKHIQDDIDKFNESVGYNVGDKSTENVQIGDKKAAILAFIADNPNTRASVIADFIGLKASRTRDYLSELVKDGKLITNGANKNRTYSIKK